MQRDSRDVDFDELPLEILLEIYSYLGTTDISSASLVNKHCHQAATDNWLWMMKFKQHFPHLFIKFSNKKDINWYTTFCHAHYDEYQGSTEQDESINKRLFPLVKNGDRKRLKKEKIKLDDLDLIDKNRISLLAWAKKKNNQPLLDYFFKLAIAQYSDEKGRVIPDKIDFNGRTILYWAIALNQDCERISLLFFQGSKFDETYSHRQYQPIHIAAQEGNLDVVQLLITHHPELLNQVDSHGQTPLMWAASNGHLHIVEYLLEQDEINLDAASRGFTGKKTSNNGRTALHWAACHGHSDVVAALLKADVTTTPTSGPMQQYQTIHIAAREGNLDVVQLLIIHHPELLNQVDSHGQTPLMWAASNGHLHIVEYLLEQDEINLDAASRGFTGKKTSNNGRTALHWAAYHEHVEIVKKLLKCNASPLLASYEGKTPDQISQNNYINNLILLEKLIRTLSKSEHGIVIDKKKKFLFFSKEDKVDVVRTLTAAIALKKIVIGGENIKLDDYIYELNHGNLGSIYYNLRYCLPTSVKLKNNSEVSTNTKTHRSHIG